MPAFKGRADGNRVVAYETIVTDRTSAASGTTTTLATVTAVDEVPLELFDELVIHLKSSQPLAGGGSLIILFQQAVVPNPDPTNSAHWDDYARFDTAAGLDSVLNLSVKARGQVSGAAGVSTNHVRAVESGLASGQAYTNHWGDRLRIREFMSGTITQNAIYSIHVKGIRYN